MAVRRRTTALLACAFLFVTATRLQAQDTASTARGEYLLGLGSALNAGMSPSPTVQLGRAWQQPGSRLGFRLTADYTGSTRSGLLYNYYAPTGTFNSRVRALTIGAAGTLDLTKSAIRPYLISGFMIQRSVMRSHLEVSDSSLVSESGQRGNSADYGFGGWNVGMQAGLGLSARIRRVTLFGEARSFVPITGIGVSRDHTSPLTFGIRF